jgi:DNA-binding response OmpR family regulator
LSSAQILVVDDEFTCSYVIQANLQTRGYTVLTGRTGKEAIELTASEGPDLLVLDLRLPDMDGFEVCRTIRSFSTLPIIMLTALTDPADRIRGLTCGADDYVPKPFNMDELIARVEASLRRLEYDQQPGPSGPLQVGGLQIDPIQRQVYLDVQEVQMMPVEFKLLCELVGHLDQVLSHEHLLAHVWGEDYIGDLHLLHQAISRIRKKIASASDGSIRIDSQYGVGYVCRATEA